MMYTEACHMNNSNEEGAIAMMVRDFVKRAGMDEELAEICMRAVDEEENGGVCISVEDSEIALLQRSPLVSTAPEAAGLFVLANKRLYTRRNWCYEQTVMSRIKSMLKAGALMPGASIRIPDDGVFKDLKERQREAIRRMASHQFTIMTGGPGTGKTYTIARAVKLITEQNSTLRLGLAAPTGKAVERVKAAMTKEAEALGIANVPETSTLHGLLEATPDFVTFRHNRENPLELDWLIVDEASMVSLSMMAKLLEALPENCRLTLVGDAFQLSSVEPGQVFGDLCRMSIVNENGCKCELLDSNRFPAGGEIATLADCIKNGYSNGALERMRTGQKLVHYSDLRQKDNMATDALHVSFGNVIEKRFALFCKQTSPEAALRELDNCRVLCAVRKGKFGCEKINAWILADLQKLYGKCPIPVMVTRNDRGLGVSNGDVGVILPEFGEKLFLPGKDAPIPLSLLPEREMAFASTVHKAQGSEYVDIVIVLPPINESADAPVNSLLTRELLYTAITRTRKEVFIFADDAAVRQCCENETQRSTGLLAIE